MRRPVREPRLIDALEALSPEPFAGTVWRVVREGREPTLCNASGGRWDDGSFEVLYTARERDGAIAEIHFHLSRGQPVFPSRAAFRLHELAVDLKRALDLRDAQALTTLGVDMARFGGLSYQERETEYPRTQDIAETAHFLGFTGLLVPSARWAGTNVVVFCDTVEPGDVQAIEDHGLVDWEA